MKCHFKVIVVITFLYIVSLLLVLFCWFFCSHIIQCLRHVTIALLLGSMFEMFASVHGDACVSAF